MPRLRGSPKDGVEEEESSGRVTRTRAATRSSTPAKATRTNSPSKTSPKRAAAHKDNKNENSHEETKAAKKRKGEAEVEDVSSKKQKNEAKDAEDDEPSIAKMRSTRATTGQATTVNGDSPEGRSSKKTDIMKSAGKSAGKSSVDTDREVNGSPEVVECSDDPDDSSDADMDDIIFVIKDPENFSADASKEVKARTSTPKAATNAAGTSDSSEDGIVYSDPEEEGSVQEISCSSEDSEVVFTKTPPARKRKQAYPMKVRLAEPSSPKPSDSPAIQLSPPSLTAPIKILSGNSPQRQSISGPRPGPSSPTHLGQSLLYNSAPPVINVPSSSIQQQTQYIVLPSSTVKPVSVTTFNNPSQTPQLATMLDAMQKLRQAYEAKLAQKETELGRLRNTIKWKDDQMCHVSTIMEKNVVLERRLSEVLEDPKAYEREVNLVQEQKRRRLEIDAQTARKALEAQRRDQEQRKMMERQTQLQKEKETDDVKVVYDSQETIDIDEEDSDSEKKSVKKSDSPSKKSKGKDNDGPEKPSGKGKGGRKGRPRRSGRNKEAEEEDIETLFVSDDERDVEDEDGGKKKGKKKGKDEETEEDKKEEESKDDEDDEHKGRHNIRKLMKAGKLQEETKTAAKEEKDRRERVEKENKRHLRVTQKDKKKMEITTKFVLAMKADKKTPMVEVNTKLIRKLKPHQVEAVEFMWNSVIESIEHYRAKKDVWGCIVAHRMGLGKTLSVVTLVHTLMTSPCLRFKTCLVVCPLNTVLNWQVEWEKWLDKKDRLPTYELASCKDNHERADQLLEWKTKGGIMILGYQIFRILANHPTRSKKKKKIFNESLLDPGPDIVVCDEGHILKNDGSQIAQCMNKIRTKRRIVLTGTPLQNNLIEYHCMVNFVKPNLLGTRREFSNRFVNPITNGQHVDSTSRDVKLMQKRAHVLHEMLAGVVQRRDYTDLVKNLPPKYEYVIAVRLSKIQIELYELYLQKENLIVKDDERFTNKGTLFADYQALLRIWTHPWVLKLDEIRQDKKALLEEYDSDFESLPSDEDAEVEDEVVSISSSSDSKEEGDNESKPEEEEEEEEQQEDSEVEELPAPRTTRRGRTTRSEATNKKSKENEKEGKEKESAVDSKKELTNKKASKKETSAERKDTPSDKKNTDKEAASSSKKDASSKKDGKKEAGTKKKSSKVTEGDGSKEKEASVDQPQRRSKVIAGEVIRQWQSSSRGTGYVPEEPLPKPDMWWTHLISEEDEKKVEFSGKLVLLFEIMRLAETLGDKVLVFSQSILSLDLIEAFLGYKNEEAQAKKSTRKSAVFTYWEKDKDYIRMDGSTGAMKRHNMTDSFNDADNKRLRLFLISTKAGGLGINLDTANRVVIFDASWNPSHDIQSIFRAYRFGQEKNVFIYRFLAQGTMEEKIYQRQVTKETLSQRVIDEHQLDRHFSAQDLTDLYRFTPDRLDDPDRKERPTPKMPEDIILRELLSTHKEWIVDYHDHDSLLEQRPEENLTEEERKAAWDEYEREKQGLYGYPITTAPPMFNNKYRAAMTVPLPGNTMPYSTSITMPSLFRYPTYFSQISYPKPPPAKLTVPAPTTINPNLATGQPHLPMSNHVAQLPKVVQEILKFNPNIAPSDLQTRLQAFLGMHSQKSTALGLPSFSMPATTPNPTTRQLLGQAIQMQPSSSRQNLPPKSQQDQAIEFLSNFSKNMSALGVPATAEPSDLPSRLPVPGTVPANKH